MTATFEVSDVQPAARTRHKCVDVHAAIRSRIGTPFEAGAANVANLIRTRIHGFVGAAHLAFDEHHELVLSPDDVWLCIAQGFALHVEQNAEQLRDRFVRHDGKEKIVVIRDEFEKGSPSNDWPGVFGEFSDAIARHIGKQRDLVVAGFTTTGPIEKAASEIVLMSAMKHYFEYVVLTRCGIPRVTLLGTPADWRSIEQRAAVLAEYGLEHWTRALAPLLAELTASSSGHPDREL